MLFFIHIHHCTVLLLIDFRKIKQQKICTKCPSCRKTGIRSSSNLPAIMTYDLGRFARSFVAANKNDATPLSDLQTALSKHGYRGASEIISDNPSSGRKVSFDLQICTLTELQLRKAEINNS